MTRHIKDLRGLPLRPAQLRSYGVGYGKPPTKTQFKPGQSGNPRGRPKGRRSKPSVPSVERLTDIILGEAYRSIKVNDGDRQISIPMVQAIIRSMALSAAKGQARSQRLFADLLSTTEREMAAKRNQWLEVAIEYKVSWEEELRRRAELGIVAPDPIPHPDHVIIDFNADEVFIRGPMTEKQKVVWDRARARLAACDASITELQAMLQDPKNKKIVAGIEQEIEFERRLRAKLAAAVG